jgi:predicted nuclease of predicted toxin-antitoxin system
MRILIDECLDERLRNSFPEHDCQTARYAGFPGLKNGELLNAAESAQFQVLITADRGFEYEQNLRDRTIALVIFCMKSNRLRELLPHITPCKAVLATIKPVEVARIA